ncbi:hypothetical protein BN938_2322 [Mucinivorans hirudinis]|uniref:Uncharacterized protein n=1 Tax=Mucinivorans hirudinis TaxID=1433126 RepID=A0A060RE60_9BACT|nr:hypothetical protein BN938_2322 [Mucinivorans hirudinis]
MEVKNEERKVKKVLNEKISLSTYFDKGINLFLIFFCFD